MKINNIEFHGAPLKELLFLLEERELVIAYLVYKETGNNYETKTVHFRNVRNICIDSDLMEDTGDMNIFEIEEKRVNGIRKVECIFLVQFAKPDFKLSFEFSSAHLDGELLE